MRDSFKSKITPKTCLTILSGIACTTCFVIMLINHWKFNKSGQGCEIEFFIDFEFRSRLLRTVMEPLFHEAVRRMVAAFEQRAAVLYG